jgi:sec-independent protein translocase protein TatC
VGVRRLTGGAAPCIEPRQLQEDSARSGTFRVLTGQPAFLLQARFAMAAKKKDLFDDSMMTFGEHLEVLRVHLWRAIIGLAIGSTAAFFFSDHVIRAIQEPVTQAMEKRWGRPLRQDQLVKVDKSPIDQLKAWLRRTFSKEAPPPEDSTNDPAAPARPDPAYVIHIDVREVARKLNQLDPGKFPALPEEGDAVSIEVPLADTEFGKLISEMRSESLRPRTDGPDEAFMIYLKVSLIVGVLVSSPWIFYQLWMFVAAGLYAHERKFVYMYLPLSIGLFLGGALFCFYVVLPYVLSFLFEFNDWLGLRPEIKISTWITFALVVSLMFGVSFQLPVVMLLLERISLVSASLYREKRKYAILVIAFLSMVLTPSDPVSMIMMMVPLCLLYELGILLCGRGALKKSPFQAQPA